MSNKDTGRDVQHAVFSIEVLDRDATPRCITFAKDFLKVAVQKLNYSIIDSSIHCFLCRRSAAASAPVLAKYIAASMLAELAGDLRGDENICLAYRCICSIRRQRPPYTSIMQLPSDPHRFFMCGLLL